jgi:uncharacterized membrane protein YagU involved in acid resistance
MQKDIEAIYSTKYPWSISIGLFLDFLFVILFSYRVILGDFSLWESLFLLIGIVFLIHLIVCPFAGKVVVSENMLKVKYFFVWNENFEIELSKITSINVRSYIKNRTYSKIYLTLNENESKIINLQTYMGFQSNETIETILERIIKMNKQK